MALGLRAKKNSGDSGPDSLALVFFIAMIFFTVYNFFFGRYNLIELKKIRENLTNIEARLQSLKKENSKLEEELELVEKYGDSYLEELVRQKMQLQRPDERIILFKK